MKKKSVDSYGIARKNQTASTTHVRRRSAGVQSRRHDPPAGGRAAPQPQQAPVDLLLSIPTESPSAAGAPISVVPDAAPGSVGKPLTPAAPITPARLPGTKENA